MRITLNRCYPFQRIYHEKREENMKEIKGLLLILCLFSQGQIFSQGNSKLVYSDNPISTIIFEMDNKITVYIIDPITGSSTEKHGIYVKSIKNGIPFIDVTWNNKTKETFLMLSNDVACFLYKATDPTPYCLGFSGGYNRGELIFRTPKTIRASSHLIENGKPYLPDQINSKLDQAWVEGAKGQGIHEKLFISRPDCTIIYVSIGFVSYERPFLYQENSRPSKIKVSVPGLFSLDVNLLDTPDFQTIKLPKPLGRNDILEIEILEVYSGTKYEDTCINFILYDTVSSE